MSRVHFQQSLPTRSRRFTSPIGIAAILFATLCLAPMPALAEAVGVKDRVPFRSIKAVEVRGGETYFLTAGQKVDGADYELRYNNQFPGEELHVLPDNQMDIQLTNQLDGLAVEILKRLRPCVVGQSDSPEVMDFISKSSSVTNLHTHGLHVSPSERSDNVMLKIEKGNQNLYEIQLPGKHAPGTHWYHAHLHGSTALQVQGGMAGALIVDPLRREQDLSPPVFRVQEHVMVLQFGAGWNDTQDNTGCKDLGTAKIASLSSLEASHIAELVNVKTKDDLLALANRLDPEQLSGLVGALGQLQADLPPVLVNGVENPVLDVQQDVAVQRLRVINAGSRNQDYKELWIENRDTGESLPMYVGAFDGVNLADLPKNAAGEYIAYTEDNKLELAPGNRADIFIVPDTSGSFVLMMEGEVGVRDEENEGAAPEAMSEPPSRERALAKRLKFRRSLLTFEVGGPDHSDPSNKALAAQAVDTNAFLLALDNHLKALQESLPAYADDDGYLRPFEDGQSYIQRKIRFNVVGRSFRVNDRDYNEEDSDGHMKGHYDYLGKGAGDGGQGPDGQTPWPLRSDTEEEWTIVNESRNRHPFHIHVSPFWVVDIVERDNGQADGKLISVLETNPDDPRLNRWLDVVNLPPHKGSVRVRHRVSEFDGVYVIHCHILQHEDRGMMINVLTVPNDNQDPQAYFDQAMARNDEINREINP